MIQGKKIAVVLPAYNAAKTLVATYREIPHDIVDFILLVDDCSNDETVKIAKELKIETIRHDFNKGYGGNQKTCYKRACDWGADIVIMLHPDYQYTPKLIRAMASLISEGLYDVVLGSRILGKGALKGGMPFYKYLANRFLTFAQNILIGQKLSEYHTGYRAFNRKVFDLVRIEENRDGFIFDNEMLVQCHGLGLRIAEITCPTLYFDDASSIKFLPSVEYGVGCLWISARFFLHRWNLVSQEKFTERDLPLSLPKPAKTRRKKAA